MAEGQELVNAEKHVARRPPFVNVLKEKITTNEQAKNIIKIMSKNELGRFLLTLVHMSGWNSTIRMQLSTFFAAPLCSKKDDKEGNTDIATVYKYHRRDGGSTEPQKVEEYD